MIVLQLKGMVHGCFYCLCMRLFYFRDFYFSSFINIFKILYYSYHLILDMLRTKENLVLSLRVIVSKVENGMEETKQKLKVSEEIKRNLK